MNRKALGTVRGDDAPMNTSSAFEQLVAAAREQSQPQVLLFVFAGAELPANPSAAQRASFHAGAGGELTPLMCVEKTLEELSTFETLLEESRAVGPPWQVLFAAGLGGTDGLAPTPAATESALKTMVERVKNGAVDGFLALSAQGEPLRFV